jgi:hypothetical protein
MVERSSRVADSPDPRRLGTEWFLDAVFPNGKTVTIRGLARESEASERPVSFRYVKSTCDGRGGLGAQAAIGGQLFPANLDVAIASTPGLTAPVAKTPTRLSEKWRAATSSPWFPLLCAGGSFAALLVFTAVLAGAALTKQPARIDMTVPRVEASTAERRNDDDPIAMLIERISVPEEGPSVGPASSRPF